MRWEDALAAASQIDVPVKLAAYELSYHYLEGGPDRLDEQEQDLRRRVSQRADGAEMSLELGRDLFAWMNASYMARRRRPGELPEVWREGLSERE